MAYKDPAAQLAASRLHYQNNKQYYIDRNKRMVDDLRAILQEAKDRPCTDCGVKYPSYVMQFDHIEDNKEYTVARMVSGGSKRKLLTEIAKCEVVCANCHAERTHSRLV